MNRNIRLSTVIPEEFAGKRLDQALASLFSEHSRARLQGWIRQGKVKLDDKIVSQRHKLTGGEQIEIHAELETQIEHSSENIPLKIIFEDEHLIVLNKPAGIIVHPGAGHSSHTLLNALLHYDEKLQIVPRAGIVHRLDKDTTGLMIVAKTPESHTLLIAAMQERQIKREYQALVRGFITAGGTINEAIGRHPHHRTRMAIVHKGKDAVTHYRVLNRFKDFSLLNCQLETGRTHQIRVHMAHIHHPIVGDPVYGGRLSLPKSCSESLANTLRNFKRQALHAWQLGLTHPFSGEALQWQAPLPEDFQSLLDSVVQEES